MNIHLIEDDSFKCSTITNFINDFDPSINIEISQSVGSGLRYLVRNRNNISLLLLDMSMPSYDDDKNTF